MSSKNPFTRLWNFLGILGGVLSLSSMVQTWFDDLVQWRGFLSGMVANYREVRAAIFATFPFDAPHWLQDYLVFGAIIGVAMANSFAVWMLTIAPLHPSIVGWRRRRMEFAVRAGTAWMTALTWPFHLAVMCVPRFVWNYLDKKDGTNADPEQVRAADRARRDFWSWLATILLAVAILLAINATLRERLV